MIKRNEMKWGCHHRQFHNTIKELAAKNNTSILEFEKILSEDIDSLKKIFDSNKQKKVRFQVF